MSRTRSGTLYGRPMPPPPPTPATAHAAARIDRGRAIVDGCNNGTLGTIVIHRTRSTRSRPGGQIDGATVPSQFPNLYRRGNGLRKRRYLVKKNGEQWECNGPDYQRYRRKCKHVYATELEIRNTGNALRF